MRSIQRIFVHTDQIVDSEFEEILKAYDIIQTKLKVCARVPDDLETVLHKCNGTDGTPTYRYYLASWKNRGITWAEEVEDHYLTENSRIVKCGAHLSTFH